MSFQIRKHNFSKIILTLFLSSIFLITTFSKVFALSLSPEIGKIQETRYGWNGKTLILIQESHVDYEGQKSLIKILEAIMAQKPLRQVLVEGGWNNVSLRSLRNYGDAEGRRKIAEKYLKSGEISGEEYLDIVGEHDMELWGIEDQKLYDENMKAFLKIQDSGKAPLENLSKLETFLQEKAKKVFSKELLLFEELRKSYQDQKISLPVYLKWLSDHRPLTTDHSKFPHLSQILELSGDSKNFDADKVEPEKRTLIKFLSKQRSKLELAPVLALEEKKTLEAEIEFLNALLELVGTGLENKNKSIPDFKNLKAYQAALSKMQTSDLTLLFIELNQLEVETAKALSKTAEEKNLIETIRYVEAIRKLFELKMTPEEYSLISKSLPSRQAGEFLNPKLGNVIPGNDPESRLNGSRIMSGMTEVILSFIPIASSFYESAIKREQAFIKNITERTKSTPDSMSVVITGGFHSKHLMGELHKRGYTVLSVTPRFNPEDPAKLQEKYFRILREKWKIKSDQ